MYSTDISLDLFNGELFKSTNGGCDRQPGDKSLKFRAFFGEASVNMFNCRFILIVYIAGKPSR
jgi:hypothetical protein